MLIPHEDVIKNIIKQVRGIIHIGAHECEEQDFYYKLNIQKNDVLWFEALKDKVDIMKQNGFNIYNEVISDEDDKEVLFNVTNNYQSSSILELGTHLNHNPHVHVTNVIPMKTRRIDTFFYNNNIYRYKYNFVNLDIQGAELKALKGMEKYLKESIDYVYTEVNLEKVYVNCALLNEIDEYLGQFGFVRKITDITPYRWGDAFYVKN